MDPREEALLAGSSRALRHALAAVERRGLAAGERPNAWRTGADIPLIPGDGTAGGAPTTESGASGASSPLRGTREACDGAAGHTGFPVCKIVT